MNRRTFIKKRIKYQFHGDFVIFYGRFNFERVCAGFSVGDVGAVYSYAVNKTFCEY